MDKPGIKSKKGITPKKVQELIAFQAHIDEEKHYNPGKIDFLNTDHCRSRIVNFFGDVHTQVFSVKASPDDRFAGAGCANGEVKVYDIMEGSCKMLGNTSRKSGFPCTSFRWKPISPEQFLAINCDGTLKWYSSRDDKAYGHYEREEVAYLCADYQHKQEWCVCGTDQDTLEVFDNETMKPKQEYKAGGVNELTYNHHTNRVFCVKCLPDDPNVFFSGGWDSTVQIWDIRAQGGSVRRICGPSISADSLDLKKGVLLAGNYQNNDTVQLYDFGKGELIQTLDIGQPHNSSSYCLCAGFAQRSQYDLLAVGLSGSNKVKVIQSGKVVCEMQMQAAPLALDFYRFNNKDFLLVGGVEGTVYCIKVKCLK